MTMELRTINLGQNHQLVSEFNLLRAMFYGPLGFPETQLFLSDQC